MQYPPPSEINAVFNPADFQQSSTSTSFSGDYVPIDGNATVNDVKIFTGTIELLGSGESETATLTNNSLMMGDTTTADIASTLNNNMLEIKNGDENFMRNTFEGFSYKTLVGANNQYINQGTIYYADQLDQCAMKLSAWNGSSLYDTIINRTNLTQIVENGVSITSSKTALISDVIDAGNGTFTNQVSFSNFAPHSETLPTQYNDLTTKQYVDNLVGTNSGTGLLMYLNYSVSSGISTYKQLANQYSLLASTTNTTPSLGTNLVAGFITDSNIPYIYGGTISAGIFNLNLYAYVSTNTGTLNAYYTINKYDTITSTPTLIATSGNSSDINGTNSSAPDLYHMSCSFPSTSFLSTDRLLILIYTVGTGMGSGATISTEFQGSYYSYLLTPISSGNLIGADNSWTGTNTFLNTVSLYQPTITTGPLTMPVDSSILYGNTGTLSIGNSTNNISNSTGIRLPSYIDGVDLTGGIYLGYNHSGPTAYLRTSLPILADGTTTNSALYCNYIHPRFNSNTLYLGGDLTSGSVQIGNATMTGGITIGSTTAGTQSLNGIWNMTQLRCTTLASNSSGATVALYTALTGTLNVGGGCTMNLNTTGNTTTKLGNIGNTQIGTSTSLISTSNNIQQISSTNSISLYTLTTGTITIGSTITGTQTLGGTWTIGTGLKTNSITGIAVGNTVGIYPTSTGTVSIGDNAGILNIGAGSTVGDIQIGSASQSGTTSLYSGAASNGITLLSPLYSNYGLSYTSSKQIGWTVSSNASQSTANQTAVGTYTVYATGSGATLHQLTAGVYLFCGNGSLVINNGTGTTNLLSMQVVYNATSATSTSTTINTLISPPNNLFGQNMYLITPFTGSQVITVSSVNNNKYYGFSANFSISAVYNTGNVKMLFDSYSITRIA